MSCAPARAPYTGANPGADANTYTLFSTLSFPARMFTHSGHTRINVSLLGDAGEGGTLQLRRYDVNGLNGAIVHDDAVTFVAGEAQVYDYQTGLYDHFALEWVNDGAAKTTFLVDVAMMPEHTPTQ